MSELPNKLKDAELESVVVGEVDCCKQSDFCLSSDRKTKCLMGEMAQGTQLQWY